MERKRYTRYGQVHEQLTEEEADALFTGHPWKTVHVDEGGSTYRCDDGPSATDLLSHQLSGNGTTYEWWICRGFYAEERLIKQIRELSLNKNAPEGWEKRVHEAIEEARLCAERNRANGG